MEPPPLLLYPQLGIVKSSTQHAAKTFWATMPAHTFSGVNSIQMPSISGIGAISQEVKQLDKPTETEPFPRIGRAGPTSNDTGKDLWACFRMDEVSRGTSITQRTSPQEEGNSFRLSVHKPSKKKKWEPLLI